MTDIKPSVVYIFEGCKISETDKHIYITEPNGTVHMFPTGSYVFSNRKDVGVWP